MRHAQIPTPSPRLGWPIWTKRRRSQTVKELFKARGLRLAYLTEHNRERIKDMGLGDYLQYPAFCFRPDGGEYFTLGVEDLPSEQQKFILAHGGEAGIAGMVEAFRN